jgi:hypothetical protein
MSCVPPVDGAVWDEEVLRSVIDELAAIPRLPTSVGERRAAQLIRKTARGSGCRAVVEEVSAYSSYAWPIGLLAAVSATSALSLRVVVIGRWVSLVAHWPA